MGASLNIIKKEIARHIVLSQIASDGGKRINLLKINNSKKVAIAGYDAKDHHICMAIKLIKKNRRLGFSYYIKKDLDQNGYESTIIYFCFKDETDKLQISFHSFNEWGDKQGLPVHWDHKDSRKNCQILVNKFNLFTNKKEKVFEYRLSKKELEGKVGRRPRF